MPGDDRRSVIPSPVDPDVECVPIEPGAAEPPPVPGPPEAPGSGGPPPCPEGYVPRRKRRDYELEGKRIVSKGPSLRNPADPPDPEQR